MIAILVLLVGVAANVLAVKENYYDVVILGGGFSGIGAAKHLHDNGLENFLVLEAKGHLGGRVQTEKFFGKAVPLGAAWIHQPNGQNIIWKLAKKYNVTFHKDPQDVENMIIRNVPDGKIYSKRYVSRTLNELLKSLSNLDQGINMRRENHFNDISLKTGLRLAGWESYDDNLKQALEYFMLDFQNGIEPNDVSAGVYSAINGRHNSEIEKSESGGHYTITDPRGYEFIIQEEAKGFRNKIRFHHEVKSIERRPDSIYRVTTSSWERFYARHVLVTFSTGVLLSDEINFKPSLPIWKQQALLMVPMGHHCKIFMMFPRAFWDNKGYILLANKLRGRYMHYQNYKDTALFPNSNILLLTMTGQSCHDSHHLSDAEITQEIMVTLRRVYPFATYPTAILRSRWSTDKHFRGAYSYPVTGIMQQDYNALRHPISKSLWFTGEYLGAQNGFTHGAYQYGIDIAKDIVNCLKGDCPKELPDVEKKSCQF